MPANGARTTVSADALRARSTRARAASSERNDCCATFCASWYCCRAACTCVSFWSYSACETTFWSSSDLMRAKSASAQSSEAFAFRTSGTCAGSNPCPAVRPSRASSCAALACASRSDASASVADRRTSTAPAATFVPRSTGVPTTRPPISAATSACSSAESEPVTRRKRSMGCDLTVAACTATGAGSFGVAALVRSPLQAAERSADSAAPVSRGARNLRIMTRVLTVVSRRCSRRPRARRGVDRVVARIEGKAEVAPRAGLEAEQRGVDGGARERVAVLAGCEPIAQAERGGAVRGREQQPEDGVRGRIRRARAGRHSLLDAPHHVVLHLTDEAEAIPVIADPRHAAVQEHQREVLGMLLAEFVVTPEDPPQGVGGIVVRRGLDAVGVREEQAEPFLGQREEDVVLAREIAVDRRRAVLDPVGD